MADFSSATPPGAGEPPEGVSAVRFGVFELDLEAAELRKRGLRVRLQEQPFRVLSLLLEQPGRVVSREELQSKLWPGDTFVDFDHGLNTAVNKIRQALGDSAANPRFIETMHRRGYRFIAPVEHVEAGDPLGSSTATSSEASPAVQQEAPESPPSPAPGPAAVQIPGQHSPAGQQSPPEDRRERSWETARPAGQPTAAAAATISPSPEPAPNASSPDAMRPVKQLVKVGGITVLGVSIAFLAVLVFTVFGVVKQRLERMGDDDAGRIAPAMVNQVRILAGQTSDYLSPADKPWSRDRYFVGGETTRRAGVVIGTDDTNLFRGERYGRFQYVIPASPGKYRLTIHFAETWFGAGNNGGGGQGSRVFDVECNGTYLLRGFDVYREAGGANRAIARSFDGVTPNDQGHIVITFLPRANNAMINALELTPL